MSKTKPKKIHWEDEYYANVGHKCDTTKEPWFNVDGTDIFKHCGCGIIELKCLGRGTTLLNDYDKEKWKAIKEIQKKYWELAE